MIYEVGSYQRTRLSDPSARESSSIRVRLDPREEAYLALSDNAAEICALAISRSELRPFSTFRVDRQIISIWTGNKTFLLVSRINEYRVRKTRIARV